MPRTQCFSNVEPEDLIDPVEHRQATDEGERDETPEWARTYAPENIPWYYDPLVSRNDKAKSAR